LKSWGPSDLKELLFTLTRDTCSNSARSFLVVGKDELSTGGQAPLLIVPILLGSASMRSVTVALALVVLVLNASRIDAGPHGGGHPSAPPKPPHFSAPPASHFSQPMPAHANAPHSNVIHQESFNSGSMPHFSAPRYSTANKTKTNTKLHNLANALQNAHANKSNQTGPHSSNGQREGLKAAADGGAVAANPNRQSNLSSGLGTSAISTSASTTTPVRQPALVNKFSLSSTGTSGTSVTTPGQSAIKGTFSLSNTGSSGSSLSKAFRLDSTGPNLTVATGTPTVAAPNPSTGSTTTIAATNPGGLATTLTPAGASLMSHLYGAYGYPHYGLWSSGRRFFGSGFYGNRGYGNRNNSMYFAQMRQLARLANDLNTLSRGSGVSTNMTSRIRGDLMGVVFGNGMPPYQPVHQLTLDLVTHIPTRATPIFNSGQLARELMVVMNGGGHNMMQVQNAIGSAHSVLNVSGVNQQGIQKIVNDMTMVASWGNGANALTQLLR
jgi:hypothetical protein